MDPFDKLAKQRIGDSHRSRSLTVLAAMMIALVLAGLLDIRFRDCPSLEPEPSRGTAAKEIRNKAASVTASVRVPPVARDRILCRRYADIIPELTPEQYGRFAELMRRNAALLPARDRGLREGTYRHYSEARADLRAKLKEINQELLELLGAERFARYRDDSALAVIEREVLLENDLIGANAERLTPVQIDQLKYALLDGYRITKAPESTIYFDPGVYQYTSAEYLFHLIKRATVNRAVLADAKDYLDEHQLRELQKIFVYQIEAGWQAAWQRPKKID